MTVTITQTVTIPTALISPSSSTLPHLSKNINTLSTLPPPLPSPSSAPSCPTLQTSSRPSTRHFTWSTTDEPHVTRRRQILAAHPEIRSLFGTEPLTFPIVVLISFVQCILAYYMQYASWPLLLFLAWALGGTLNHSLQLAVHELTHNLGYESPLANKCCAIFANLVTCFPSSVSFQRYHFDHHQWQGVDGVDTDIPTCMETWIFTTPLGKMLWLLLQPLFYAFRPTIISPKPFGQWELINFVVVLSFDVLILYAFGFRSLAYLALGTMLGLGLHPAAGHFVAEHYELVSGQETYSYYGAFNYVNFNVGYHNEHHDFPRIPWSRLPLVKRMAPEFYDTLPHYTSYLALFWTYITDQKLGPHARIKREEGGGERKLKAKRQKQPISWLWVGLLGFSIFCLVGISVGSLYFR